MIFSSEIRLSQPDFDELFFVPPSRINDVIPRIVGSKEAVMAFGLITQNNDFREVSRKVAAVLLEDPEYGAQESTPGSATLVSEEDAETDEHRLPSQANNLGRFAVESGFLYGNLLGGSTPANRIAPVEPVEYLAEIAEIREKFPKIPAVNFQILREIEMLHTGSTLIALSMAHAQAHMSEIFVKSKQKDIGALSLDSLVALKTLFYAGAVAGVLAVSRGREIPNIIELTRGILEPTPITTPEVGFTRDDDVTEVIQYLTTNKYVISPVRHFGRQGFGVVPGPQQVSPDTIQISTPLLFDDVLFVDAEKTDAVILHRVSKSGKDSLVLIKDVESYYRNKDFLGADLCVDENTVAIISDKRMLSAIDQGHPWTFDLAKLCVKNGITIDAVVNDEQMKASQLAPDRKTFSGKIIRQLLTKKALVVFGGIAAGLPWVEDLYKVHSTHGEENITYLDNFAVTGYVGLMLILILAASRHLKRGDHKMMFYDDLERRTLERIIKSVKI